MRFIPLLPILLLVVMMAVPTICKAAQATIRPGTTSNFAILAGSTITNTGTTIINGSGGVDIGLYPGTSFTGDTSISMGGAVHLKDDVAITAKTDLVTAYDDAAGILSVTRIPTELGNTTLKQGVYDSASGTFKITGTLILDAEGDPNAVFIFKTASTIVTATGSDIKLINGASSCRVFWKIGSSATLGTDSNFVGRIFALQSITATTGAKIQGQLLARNGAVTLDTNVITNQLCETTPILVTITGGQLPNTSTPLYMMLVIGVGLTLIGIIGLKNKKHHE